MMNNTQRIILIRQRLEETLHPLDLDITDNSQQHIGHPGAQSGAGHFSITITSAAFNNKPSIECHRMIYSALTDLMNKEIHALQISTKPTT